ncbi:unnamed protein product [Rotaria magnacalcarata]|uniref:protein acetyllysine N-acetyltransferase n=2 Tax=Rotaria magnacalcarata TaxID=392030 RepID=A0A816EGM6_9BILA|nr:unnamed protein product [Rotaria magnacalcarata]CAF1648896.1 unnamed protein product [Rotaria magnacalcarata]CAF2203620.1 unnamed protein product [Rotaria magnacalcarata]CAF3939779.1 unnamed protein product [Rotaria magnacalcarata]CAF3953910.1 unnamed protein product [Rotaria magnacalcarata]
MAHGLSDAEMKKEYFDAQDKLDDKLDKLAKWIKESKHFIIFTGAGVSTSTGIPDFRSAMDTVLPTGPGAWELRDNKTARSKKAVVVHDMQKAIPSLTHMALVELQRRGILKCLVSQNCDGLHLRSGMNPTCLAELHGNMNLEKCSNCGAKYLRDYDAAIGLLNHLTGRKCDKPECRGPLKDSIINFGENLPAEELDKAFTHAQNADLCLVLGSSLTVTPAADIPRTVAERKKKLVIGNLQRTPLYSMATLNVHAFSDTIMQGLMERLDIPIPPWIVRRRVRVTQEKSSNDSNCEILIEGRDPDNTDIPFSLFKSIQLNRGEKAIEKITKEPFIFGIASNNSELLNIHLEFFGHYNEIPFDLNYANVNSMPQQEEFYLFYNPMIGQWRKTTKSDDFPL